MAIVVSYRFVPSGDLPVEAGRYRLVASGACPWCRRVLIARRLLGLTEAIPVSWSYGKGADGYWELTGPDGEPGVDPALGARSLAEVYATTPGYTPPPTVPALVDTTTGQVTSERLTEEYSTFQLTDTAFFDGTTAYNLSDGQARWTLEAGTTKGNKFFIGPAGHNSFVIDMMLNPKSRHHKIYDLTLASDKDPSQNTTASNFPEADESSNDRPVSINGWTVQYAEKVDDPDHYTAWQMQAVSFDSLAGLEDTPAVDLGKTFGPNVVASHASGTLALQPDTSSSDPAAQQVGTVFGPATRTVTPASECAGPVAVRLGITRVADGGAVSRALAIQPCDGSDGLTLPVVPGPFRPPTKTEKSAPRQLSERSQAEQIATMVNAPGATLIVFNPEGEIKANGTSDIDRKYPYHLYALAGDAS